ncbi:hypothetical protein CLOM_g15985 [Closterium sp. NIES-68]|nr:hypothetical protein CLOM_g15985 [Closterium sp. NIES-68]GJP66270.1 hypothetical protein CLOP_g23160 [Closterium sp. NIES-67]
MATGRPHLTAASARFEASAPGKVILFGEHSVVHGKLCVAGSISLRTHVRLDLLDLDRLKLGLPPHPEPPQQLNPSPEQQPPDVAPHHPPQQSPPLAEPHHLVLSSPSTNAYIRWPIASLHRIARAHPAAFPAPAPLSPTRLSEEHRAAMEELLEAGEGVDSLGGPSERAGVAAFLFLLSRIMGLQPALVTVTSDIPPGAGLGSSAAFSTALTAAMLSAASAIPAPAIPAVRSLQSPSAQEQEQAQEVSVEEQPEEQRTQGGTGSGGALVEAGAGANSESTQGGPNIEWSQRTRGALVEAGEEAKRVVSAWAYEAEQIIHGKASGVDNHVCCHGGITSFQQGQAHPIPSALPLSLLLTNTRVPRSTRLLVSRVTDRLAAHADAVSAVLCAMHHIALQASQLLQQHQQQESSEAGAASATAATDAPAPGATATGAGEAAGSAAVADKTESVGNTAAERPEPEAAAAGGTGPSDSLLFSSLGTLVSMNQGLLSALGVSHHSIDAVCMASARHGLPSKLTGAGGGGCVITLLPPGTAGKTVRMLQNELKDSLGFDCFEVCLGGEGVMLC